MAPYSSTTLDNGSGAARKNGAPTMTTAEVMAMGGRNRQDGPQCNRETRYTAVYSGEGEV